MPNIPNFNMIYTGKIPTNSQLREQAIISCGPIPGKGKQGEYLGLVLKKYLELQYQYFPMFCEDTRIVNKKQEKMFEDYGHRTPVTVMGKHTFGGTTGWSKDKKFKHKWVISDQLRSFMLHIDPLFWTDENATVRNSFMNGILRGDDSYELLRKVYSVYGKNATNSFTQEDTEEPNIST